MGVVPVNVLVAANVKRRRVRSGIEAAVVTSMVSAAVRYPSNAQSFSFFHARRVDDFLCCVTTALQSVSGF